MPSFTVTKDRISSPLEAGTSLLDDKQFPPQLTNALDYVSSKLARRRLHLSLIVVRKEIQIPSYPSSRYSSKTPVTPNPYGLTLMHASSLTEKAEKILRHTIAKAEKKFNIGSGWLPLEPLSSISHTTLTNDLVRRSLAQNEVLFSSEGLTLLSLDHIYSFKCHLHTYTRSFSLVDLTSAVDELHRLVLAQNGRRITKGYLMRAYDWLGVSLAALVDVNEGYKNSYGGPSRNGGIEINNPARESPAPLALKTDFATSEIRQMRMSASTYSDNGSTYTSSSASDLSSSGSEDEWREDRGPHKRGPMTPNGFGDITPITKGEWSFLMVGDGWSEPRMAPVETC